jgi:hypothetical protein
MVRIVHFADNQTIECDIVEFVRAVNRVLPIGKLVMNTRIPFKKKPLLRHIYPGIDVIARNMPSPNDPIRILRISCRQLLQVITCEYSTRQVYARSYTHPHIYA